jgi:hypothetical protein
MTWTLHDADRITIRWLEPGRSIPAFQAERSSGDWAHPKTGKAFRQSPGAALEALTHLQIEHFETQEARDPSPAFVSWVVMDWLDRKDRKLTVEIDRELRVRTSDRPGSIFRLHREARRLLSPSAWTN